MVRPATLARLVAGESIVLELPDGCRPHEASCPALLDKAVRQGVATNRSGTGGGPLGLAGLREGEFDRVAWKQGTLFAWPRGGPVPIAEAPARLGLAPLAAAGKVFDPSGIRQVVWATGKPSVYLMLDAKQTAVELLYRGPEPAGALSDHVLQELQRRAFEPRSSADCLKLRALVEQVAGPAFHVALLGSSRRSQAQTLARSLGASLERCAVLPAQEQASLEQLLGEPAPSDFATAQAQQRRLAPLLEAAAAPALAPALRERIEQIARQVEREIDRLEQRQLWASAAVLSWSLARWTGRNEGPTKARLHRLTLAPLRAAQGSDDPILRAALAHLESELAARLSVDPALRSVTLHPAPLLPIAARLGPIRNTLEVKRRQRVESVVEHKTRLVPVEDPRLRAYEQQRERCGKTLPLQIGAGTLRKDVVKDPITGKTSLEWVKVQPAPPPSQCPDQAAFDKNAYDIAFGPKAPRTRVEPYDELSATLDITEEEWTGGLEQSVELAVGGQVLELAHRTSGAAVLRKSTARPTSKRPPPPRDELKPRAVVEEQLRERHTSTLRPRLLEQIAQLAMRRAVAELQASSEAERDHERRAIYFLWRGDGEPPTLDARRPVPSMLR